MFINKEDLPADIDILTEEKRPAGKPHVKSLTLINPWLFDDSGRYAVSVESNDVDQYDWYYWYNDWLILIHTARTPEKSHYYCFTLDHTKRKARLAHVRSMFDGITFHTTRFFTPSPHGVVCLEDIVAGIEGQYTLPRKPMAYGSSIFLLKVMDFPDHYLFRQDCLIEINLSKLQDVYGLEIDHDKVIAEQDITAYSEVQLKIDNVPQGAQIHFLGTVIFGSRSSSSHTGFQHVLHFRPVPGARNVDCIIDLKSKELVQFARSIRDTSKICECLHPSGNLLKIYYGNDNMINCKKLINNRKSMPTLKEIAKQRILLGKKITNIRYLSDIVDRFFNCLVVNKLLND